MIFSILNPSSVKTWPILNMLWEVPLTHIVDLSFILLRINDNHRLLNSSIWKSLFDLSQSPLLTLTTFPFFIVKPSFDKKYGGAANTISNFVLSFSSDLNVSWWIKENVPSLDWKYVFNFYNSLFICWINLDIEVRLYNFGIALNAFSSLFLADNQPCPSVIHTNSYWDVVLILDDTSV